MPHRIVGATPTQCLRKPAQLSMWGNDTYGDCTVAEEAFAKACNSPEIFIPDATVISWANANGAINGDTLIDVLDKMQSGGFALNGQIYDDGPCNSVDWTDAVVLQNAIAQWPVKIGVAADQLENVVPDPPKNGWLATGFTPDSNEDHCVSLCGYGEIGWLANELGVGSPIPGSTPAYALFTWSSVGIIDAPSLLAITSEAWVRVPTTVVKGA